MAQIGPLNPAVYSNVGKTKYCPDKQRGVPTSLPYKHAISITLGATIELMKTGAISLHFFEIIRILDIWPWATICNVYALTEAGPVGTFMEIFRDTKKLTSIGLPWTPDQEIRIVDDEGRNVGVGEVGEIIFRGPNVMKGYYKNPESTQEALRDDWLYTGDLVSYDDDGFFYFMGRKKDMIVRGGFNV